MAPLLFMAKLVVILASGLLALLLAAPAVPADAVAQRYCPHDGTEHAASDRFCRECGQPLPTLDPARFVPEGAEGAPGEAAVLAEEAVRRALQSVVRVENVFTPELDEMEQLLQKIRGVESRPVEGMGSGFVLDDAGHIVTNWHVVQAEGDDQRLKVTFADGRSAPARLVQADKATDLAVLAVEGDTPPPLPWADTSDLSAGTTVFCLGHPLDIGLTATRGIVTSSRKFRTGDWEFEEFLAVDAEIAWGNSGGPAINRAGEVVGINDLDFFWGRRTAFLISAQLARRTVARLVTGQPLRRGYLGVVLHGVGADEQPEVVEVIAGTPAERAGLQAGDILLQLDGAALESAIGAQLAVAGAEPASEVDLYVRRGGTVRKIRVTLEERPEEPRPLSLISVEKMVGCRFEETERGVLARDVDPLGHAAKALLLSGDVVHSALPVRRELSRETVLAYYRHGASDRRFKRRFIEEASPVKERADLEAVVPESWAERMLLLMLVVSRPGVDEHMVVLEVPAPLPMVA